MALAASPSLRTLEFRQKDQVHFHVDPKGGIESHILPQNLFDDPDDPDDPNYPVTQIDGADPTTLSLRASELATAPDLKVAQDHTSSRSGSVILEKQPVPEIKMPDKKYTRFLRNLRWTIFSVYRRLNALALIANIIAIMALATQRRLLSMSPEWTATAVSINLTVGVLVRQELIINALFWMFGKCPRWFPLRFRRLAAKIYHLGGLHSGAGMAAVVWFAFFNVSIVRALRTGALRRHQNSIPINTVILDVLLISIIAMAHPGIRTRMHNQFELVHRFAGWTAVALFWAEFGLLADARVRDVAFSIPAQRLVLESPIFWALMIATISIALPWVWLRKVAVNAEPLSDHAIRLHFTYTNLPLCAAPRLSDSPLLEWHAFAGIPEEDGRGFSVLVSKAGDWTSRLIRSPPTKLWVRGIPTMGVLHVAPIFKKTVLVATGSGIGPIMSLLHKRDISCRILWSTPDPEVTYSKRVIDVVRRADPDAVIINTTVSGRPNLVKQTYELFVSSRAEAVFVISNPRVTRRVVYGLESRGIPIFAPIFDS
ncbi:uncharacterized protein A1O5_11056 [Cladophialophora psammophila CBS 110553]|uniref:FAD-binding FR-type domain-containing protein n=1 Tax=Cladophialophora psammophila CBS 110553 TaxID=1182543 RepID=W9WLD8_9EURO|nr:uncharacterized protein A1O5_11056 [Cladophialophora psammophila CBS 110553]EXJ65815.1 hypothetical protein A1O5_11056 [Cladophialophora psammophila CBS 110553]